jgi:adenosylmethionine-8-amino-7-oxononanoate aminotransferase
MHDHQNIPMLPIVRGEGVRLIDADGRHYFRAPDRHDRRGRMVAEHAGRRPYPPAKRRGLHVYLHGLQHGVLLRPVGNVVYFIPPQVITEQEIDDLVDVALAGVELATAH